jgi:hypothetical protein
VCRTSGSLTEGPGPTSSPGSLLAPRVACRCSPVGFDRQHQRAPPVSKQREDRRGNGKRKQEWPSEFGYGPKQDRGRAERENELTELVEHEWFIREREKRRKGSDRVVGADGD